MKCFSNGLHYTIKTNRIKLLLSREPGNLIYINICNDVIKCNGIAERFKIKPMIV